MYLHLGMDVVVRKQDIIGVFDLDNTSQSHITREYLHRAEKNRQVIDISGELPRSFILTAEGGRQRLYLSQITPQTLLKRFESRTEQWK